MGDNPRNTESGHDVIMAFESASNAHMLVAISGAMGAIEVLKIHIGALAVAPPC